MCSCAVTRIIRAGRGAIQHLPLSETKTLSFSREPQSVRAARGALTDFDTGLPSARVHDASVCLSELVTNAVQHAAGGGDLELTVEVDDERLRVEVADPGGGFEPGPPTTGDERGWGLFIVEQLSDRWGVVAGRHTVVWFEILHQGAASAVRGGTESAAPRASREEDDRLLRAAALRLKGRLAAP